MSEDSTAELAGNERIRCAVVTSTVLLFLGYFSMACSGGRGTRDIEWIRMKICYMEKAPMKWPRFYSAFLLDWNRGNEKKATCWPLASEFRAPFGLVLIGIERRVELECKERRPASYIRSSQESTGRTPQLATE